MSVDFTKALAAFQDLRVEAVKIRADRQAAQPQNAWDRPASASETTQPANLLARQLILPNHRVMTLPVQEVSSTSAHRTITAEQLSEDQGRAYERIMNWVKNPREKQVLSLGGYAGTGKTTLTAVVAEELCKRQGLAVAFVTPTAKAASVLKRKLAPMNLTAPFIGTVHSFMYSPMIDAKEELTGWRRRYFEKTPDGYICRNTADLPRLNLLVVDEASMVSSEMEEDLTAFGLPILAVGDHGQLPPVLGRSSWMRSPDIRLERIHRQAEDNPILAIATYVREEGRLPSGVSEFAPYYRELAELTPHLLKAYETQGKHETALITYTNRMRAYLNRSIHTHDHGTEEPSDGTQVICLKNRKPLVNGMRGFIRSTPRKQDIWTIAEVEFPDESFVYDGPFLTAQFGLAAPPKNIEDASERVGRNIDKMDQLGALLDFGYAITCHKAQGSQFQEVFVVLEQGSRPQEYGRWLYTAITRASEKLSFVETWR